MRNRDAVTQHLNGLKAKEGTQAVTAPSAIQQTHIRAGSITPASDFVATYKDLPLESRPRVDRLIVISRPLDINFAEHSATLAKQYGGGMSVRIAFQLMDAPFAHPNITLVRWKSDRASEALVTFPFLEYPATGGGQGDHTHGVLIVGDNGFDQFEKFFDMSNNRVAAASHKLAPEDVIEKGRESLWQRDPREYCRAIALSISDALWRDQTTRPDLRYIGLVGSVLDQNPKVPPRDIDLVVVLDKDPKVDAFYKMQTLVEEVIGRFSSQELAFKAVWEAGPIKPASSGLKDKRATLPVQVLVNTEATVSRWSPFISAHRRDHKEDFEGQCPISLMAPGFTTAHLLDETHGIRSLLNQIDDRRVRAMRWSRDGNSMVLRRHFVGLNSPGAIIQFLVYAARWTTRNLFLASDTPLEAELQVPEADAVRQLSEKFGMDTEQSELVAELLSDGSSDSSYAVADQVQAAVQCYLRCAETYCIQRNS